MEALVDGTIAQRVQSVLAKIRSAEERAGRPAGSVRLVAVTKTVTVDFMQEGVSAGVTIFGENRVQEALPKVAALSEAPVQWHFLGQLQRRKVRSVIGLFEMIHSVDSVELAREIDRRAGEAGCHQTVLIEVNIGNESTKAGFSPADVTQAVSTMAEFSHIGIRGLMTIPPQTDDPDSVRPYFRKLHELSQQIAACKIPSVKMDELSMGMSNDYEVAIEEGATLVRVGTAIFGTRHV
ncbi:MAG: YggS family pyridoxal phosphate-dependent enzyme [Nitrospira sp.]|nr:YggS family pyridoxal phosphate-dependent enzyme [Nitrospira sp.]